MARGNPLIDKEDLKKGESRFDPNLRDEGAGFFSTLFTAGSNIGSDAVTELGYIAQAVARPIDTGEAVLRVLAGYAQKALPNDWEKYLPEDWATNKVYANAINDYYADKYGSLEQAADSFAEQPVSVALDAFAVKALLTTVSKQAAKRSAATTKMANTAKGTVMEGELASRAAAELKVAQELERTVKYEGKLVWDDALGAYVPESSVVKPKIDAAEVAPVVAAIEDAVPNNNPAVANVADDASEAAALARTNEAAKVGEELKSAWLAGADDFFSSVKGNDGMMRATRNQEAFPGELAQARLAADPDLPYGEGTTINTATPSASTARANQIVDEINILDSIEGDRGLSASEAAKYESLWKELKLQTTRDKQRMADDAAMAAATQGELFSNANAAAYEAYQASRLANEARAANELAKAQGANPPAVRGMLAATPETKSAQLARTKDIEIPAPPSVPRITAKPESASRGFKDLEINPSRVLPAAQRVAAAASQTGLQGERDIDGSLIPIAPDKGIDLIKDEPLAIKSKYEDMPPYEKSIDNRDISGGKDKANTKPGWFQGSSVEGADDGNYWSADFEDEHWNTPAGVQEAIGIWGRPIGNKIGNPIEWSWN